MGVRTIDSSKIGFTQVHNGNRKQVNCRVDSDGDGDGDGDDDEAA